MWAFIIPIITIALDQILKFLANKNLLPTVGDFFGTISCNTGIAFGVQLPSFVFILLWVASIAAILYLLKLESKNIGLLFVLGGAVSNIIDRIFHGCVIDYISFLNIPTFNLADTAICLGIGWFVINSFLGKDTLN